MMEWGGKDRDPGEIKCKMYGEWGMWNVERGEGEWII
jgi:hypothetical protein